MGSKFNFGLNNDPNAQVAPGNWAGLLPKSLSLSSVLGKSGEPLPYIPKTLPSMDTLLDAAWQSGTSNFSNSGLNLDLGKNIDSGALLNVGTNPPTPPGIAWTDKVNAGVGVFNAGLSAINSFKANKLAKEQFAFQKDSWNREYDAQKNLTNSQLADRQAQRVREHGNKFMSVNDYMAKYGVK